MNITPESVYNGMVVFYIAGFLMIIAIALTYLVSRKNL